MKEITDIRELQKIEFDILCDIDQFCRENGIRYFLVAGTLLGAIRHKGFIPWDDDLDIGMLRPDYERFIKTYKSDRNELWWHGKQPRYFLPFAKVCAKGTLLTGGDFPDVGCGVYVDVLPYDEIDDNPTTIRATLRRWLWTYRVLTLRNIRLFRKGRPWWRQVAVFLGRPLRLVPNHWIVKWFERRNASSRTKGPCLIGLLGNGALYGTRDFHDSRLFAGTVKVEFEGHSFPTMSGWAENLTNLYGDYMTPPPEEKRIPHHDFQAWRKDDNS